MGVRMRGLMIWAYLMCMTLCVASAATHTVLSVEQDTLREQVAVSTMVFNKTIEPGSFSVTQAVDSDLPTFVWVAVDISYAVENVTWYFNVTFQPIGGETELRYTGLITYPNTQVEIRFPPFEGELGGTGQGFWGHEVSWDRDVPATSENPLTLQSHFTAVSGRLASNSDTFFGICAPSLILPLDIAGTSSIAMQVNATTIGGAVDTSEVVPAVFIYESCEDTGYCLVDRLDLSDDNAVQEVHGLSNKTYFVEFPSTLPWSDLSNRNTPNGVDLIVTIAPADSDSSSGSGSSIDFWVPALITVGVVALVVVVVGILGVIGFFVWKRQQRSIYDSV